MKVFGIHDKSACSYYRIKLPFSELARHGCETGFIRGKDVNAEAFSKIETDWPMVVLQRIDKPGAIPLVRRLSKTSKIVYEIDDDIFNVERCNRVAWNHYSKPETQQAVATLMSEADLVTVTTEFLAERFSKYASNIAVLPNFLSERVFDLPPADLSRPVIGWVGGSSHSDDFKQAAGPALRRYLDRSPDWSLQLAGFDFRKEVRHPNVITTPWVDIKTNELDYYRSLDFSIGIAPLADYSVFNRSKSYLKALEYGARGIPCIATDCDPYRNFIVHGETGFLVKQHHEWGRYLYMLARSPKLREEMGSNAREHARNFVIKDHWHLWADAYGGVLR